MALKVIFPVGTNDITVKGLYQWDYGQTLEIEASDIGTEIVEVHFACANMTEAIVRSCSFVDGIGAVTVPDQCLEQSSNITAWIYKIKGAEGHTIKTITLSVIARIKPSKLRDIPPEIYDKYTELITEVNETIDGLEKGNITAEKAQISDKANYATSAGNAASASHAMKADNATSADSVKVKDNTGSINDLVTEGRYWCTHEQNTPNSSYGICEVSQHGSGVYQFFYDFLRFGNLYIRKGEPEGGVFTWSEWQLGNANVSNSLACYSIASVEDLNNAVNKYGTAAINFASDVNMGGVTIPQYSKGIVSGQKADASLIVTDDNGNIYTAYRSNGVWKGAQVIKQKPEEASYADEAGTAQYARKATELNSEVALHPSSSLDTGLYCIYYKMPEEAVTVMMYVVKGIHQSFFTQGYEIRFDGEAVYIYYAEDWGLPVEVLQRKIYQIMSD